MAQSDKRLKLSTYRELRMPRFYHDTCFLHEHYDNLFCPSVVEIHPENFNDYMNLALKTEKTRNELFEYIVMHCGIVLEFILPKSAIYRRIRQQLLYCGNWPGLTMFTFWFFGYLLLFLISQTVVKEIWTTVALSSLAESVTITKCVSVADMTRVVSSWTTTSRATRTVLCKSGRHQNW